MIDDHALNCGCALCREMRAHSVQPLQVDRDLLASEWAKWVSETDGEANKLRAGQNGNIASPRWVALQAIARARMGATVGTEAIRA